MNTHAFIFDIETIPDIPLLKQINDLGHLSDEEAYQAVMAQRQGEGKSDFLPHYLQQVVAISCVLKAGDKLKVWSLGDESSDEAELITRFFQGIERYQPTLVTWNGSGFDLPVLHYRALKHGIQAAQYWELGERDRDYKFNNYISRYHLRHIDLMDILASYQPRANAPLDGIATMLGYPGKMGMSGKDVFNQYKAGNLKGIRDYCETDVLNTYLVYLAFEHMRGNLSDEAWLNEQDKVKQLLSDGNIAHFEQFLNTWESVCV